MPEISIPEDDLLAEYAAREAQYTVAEKRFVDQIVLPDQAAAEAFLQELQAGGDFAELALAKTGLSAEDTDLGEVTRDDLLASLVEVAFAAPEGGYSEPAQSDFGWHVFRVRGVTPGSVQAYDDVKEELRAELALEQARDALYDYATEIDDALAGGATLEEVASRFGLDLKTFAGVDGGGNDGQGQAVADLPKEREFLDEAFISEPGLESPLIETDDGGLYVLRVDRVTPSTLRPLSDVRDEVVEIWRGEQRRSLAEAAGETIISGVALGKDLSDLAKAQGLKVEESGPLTRNLADPDSKISVPLRGDLFKLDIGQTAGGGLANGGGYVVAQLTEIRDADPLADRSGLGDVEARLENDIPSDLLAQHQAAVETKAGVEINQFAVDRLFTDVADAPVQP